MGEEPLLKSLEDSILFSVNLHGNESFIRIDPPDYSKVGLIFSGGIDSTLLLILLNRVRHKRNLILTTHTISNRCHYEDHVFSILAQPMFEGISSEINIDNGGDYSGYIDQAIEKIMSREDLDIIYTGVNAVPEELKLIDHPKRPSIELVAKYSKLRCPLLSLTKDQIIAAYMQILTRDERHIFTLTRSCTNPQFNNCGSCYQCTEKQWALNKLGIKIEDFSN